MCVCRERERERDRETERLFTILFIVLSFKALRLAEQILEIEPGNRLVHEYQACPIGNQ